MSYIFKWDYENGAAVAPTNPADVRIIRTADLTSMAFAANQVYTFRDGQVAYQVPVGKKAYMVGGWSQNNQPGWGFYAGYSDAADLNTNWVTLSNGPGFAFNSSTLAKEVNNIWWTTEIPAGKFPGINPIALSPQTVSYKFIYIIEVDA